MSSIFSTYALKFDRLYKHSNSVLWSSYVPSVARSNKVQLKLLEDCASESLLDLDALSGLTEISLEVEEGSGVKSTTKLGVSMGPLSSKVDLPSQYVTMVPRYVVLNESDESITVRQCHLQVCSQYISGGAFCLSSRPCRFLLCMFLSFPPLLSVSMKDDMTGMICVSSKQRITLQLRNGVSKGTEFSLFENFIRKHRNANDDLLLYIQFQLNDSELNWSGPVCIASLGRFFLKFRKKQSNQSTAAAVHITEFAAVHVVEEGSSLVLHFKKPPDVSLPYRIENCLQDVAITYYQKVVLLFRFPFLSSSNLVGADWKCNLHVNFLYFLGEKVHSPPQNIIQFAIAPQTINFGNCPLKQVVLPTPQHPVPA